MEPKSHDEHPSGVRPDVRPPLVVRMVLLIGILVVWCAPTFATASDALALESNTGELQLGPWLEVLEDPSRTLKIEQILTSTEFVANTDTVPNFGFTSSDYWFRVRLSNQQHTEQQWFLEVGEPLLDLFEVYVDDGSGALSVRQAGDTLPFQARSVRHRTFLFPITIAGSSEITLYLHFHAGYLIVPLRLLAPSTLTEQVATEHLLFGVSYGVILAMIALHAFLYIGLKDRSQPSLILFMTSLILGQAAVNGTAYQYLWPNHPWWTNSGVAVFILLAGASGTAFTRRFLDTPSTARAVDHMLSALIFVAIALLLVTAFVEVNVAVPLALVFILVAVLCWLGAGVVGMNRHYQPARYYLLAWLLFIVGVMVRGATALGLVPSTAITNHSWQLGSVLLVILLSLALADRIQLIRQERTEAQEEAAKSHELMVRTLRDSERTLESKVAQRTTELQELNRQLLEARDTAIRATDSKSAFLASISHELRTPLNSIIGFSEILQRRAGDDVPPSFTKFLDHICTSGRHLLELINEILDLSKVEAGKMELNLQTTHLHDLVNSVCGVMEGVARKRRIELVRTMAPTLPVLQLDRARIKQVLFNLIANAVRFSPEGATVTISAATDDSEANPLQAPSIVLAVQDSGIGISEEDIERIFEPFQQIIPQHEQPPGSTGLGLALVRRFVELHHGSISVESAPGQGCTFRVYLPWLGDDQSPLEPPAP